ncbi:MAG: hypothetical protein QW506_07535 [Thermoproteota archaeon]
MYSKVKSRQCSELFGSALLFLVFQASNMKVARATCVGSSASHSNALTIQEEFFTGGGGPFLM